MNYVFFALAGTAGAAMILIGLLGRGGGRKILQEDAYGYLRPVSIRESTVFTALLADLSNRIRPEAGDLMTRLRKSGWVYQGPMEYHAKRMTMAILFFILPVAAGLILKGSFLTVAILSTASAILGFVTPDRRIAKATEDRKNTIRREMGFALEQISLMLTSGEQLEKALSSARKSGEFGRICEHIAVGKATNRTIGDILEEIRDELPEISVLNEFLELVRMESRGQNLVEPFRVMALLQRDRLENEIIEAGGRAKVRVTMLTSAFVMMSSLFVLIGPIFIIMRNTGF